MKNLDNHVRKIDYILSHPDLRMIIWEATRNCNYHCLHCCIPRGDWDQGKELNTEQVKKIYSEIAQDFGPSKIHVALTGGEATLRSDLMEVIKFLVGLKFKGVSIDSNGFNYAKDLTLIDRLYEAGMRGPTIGVDGLREGYKKTRGMDFFDEIIKVLRYIVARYPDMNLTTFTVINNHNKSEIQELFELLAEIGIKYARVATVIPIGRAAQLPKEAYQLSVDEFHELLEWVGRKRQEYREKKFPMEIELSEDGWCGLKYETITKRDNYMFFCQTGLKVAGLLYDGKIAACPHLGRNLTVQGDALTQRFSDVWKNEFKMFRTSRDWLKTGKCQDCSVWEYCRGGPLHYRDEKATMFKCLYWEDIVPVLKKFGDDDAQYISRNAQKIGIVGAENEAHTYHMKRVLESYHAQVTIIDTLNFPKNITFSLLDDNPKYQGESIDNLAAFYVRMKFYSHPPYDLEEQRAAGKLDLKSWYADYMAERERQSLLTSWLRCAALRGKRIINTVESFDMHYLK
jgi:radical SAM protein with 4Fe4S-binding SPASM domain